MACFYPLRGYRSRTVFPSGKRGIVFNARDGFAFLPMEVACGQCQGCREERARQWAVRCMHEASMHAANCFVTLTYSEAHLPPGGSLVKRDFQLFMKRLRKEFPNERIRYFHCGEYGEKSLRPHYHACLFGFDFPDKVLWSVRSGFPVWRSVVLERLWSFGRSEIGSVTFESAAYVARYIFKKVTGELAKAHYESVDLESGEVHDRLPEYTTMSRRPGIGASWFAKFGAEVFPVDSVLSRGRLMKPPLFYFKQFEILDGDGALEVARVRRRLARKLKADCTPDRLAVREKCAAARLERFTRGL